MEEKKNTIEKWQTPVEEQERRRQKIMEENAKQLKCPNCGGPLEFDPTSQKMKCTYCQTEVDVEAAGKIRDDSGIEENSESAEKQTADFRVILCKNCGAELLTDEYTTATFCSYCGSPSIVESRLTGEERPDYVVPFQFDRNKAVDAYRAWTKKGFLTPAVFKSSAVMDKISGVYVPFWLYDYRSKIHADGECVKFRHSSDARNEYTHKDFFYVCRDIDARFEKIPADASEKMDDEMMEKLEPYDYKQLKEFTMDYLSGYLSERYNMAASTLEEKVEKRLDTYMDAILAEEVAEYPEKHLKQKQHNSLESVQYVLLPVWMINYRYKGKDYSFAMNGQTGKIVGDLPVSKGKAAGVFAVTFIVMYILIMIIGGLIG
jgi:DNA-directed RNA polymerase subunit RPC12/RpoP